jgi:hypothetical protein
MLDDPQAKRGQIKDLADLDPGHRPARKLATAAAAAVGDMDHDLVRVGDLRQVRAWVPGCLPGRRPPPSPRAGRVALARPSEDGGLEEFEESFPSRRSSSATRACKVAIRRACSALAARSSTMTASLDRDGGFQLWVGGRDRGLQANQRSRPLAQGPYGTATPQAPSQSTGHGEEPVNRQ